MFPLIFPARLVRLAFGAPSAAGTSALELRLRLARHLFEDAAGFLLVNVCWGIDRQVGLNVNWRFGMYRYPAEIMTEARCCRRTGANFKVIGLSMLQQSQHRLVSYRAL
jgi:hypothetical protein